MQMLCSNLMLWLLPCFSCPSISNSDSFRIKARQRQRKQAECRDPSVGTYLFGDVTLQTGGVQWVWNWQKENVWGGRQKKDRKRSVIFYSLDKVNVRSLERNKSTVWFESPSKRKIKRRALFTYFLHSPFCFFPFLPSAQLLDWKIIHHLFA